MPNDLSRLVLQPQHLNMLRELLAKHVPNYEVLAYGSRVSGGAHDCSDLDLAIRNPLQHKQPNPHITKLQQAIQDSNLPILVDIHDWALLPQDFQRNIEADYVLLSNPELYLEQETIRTALIAGEQSGEPTPFSPSAFKARMAKQP